SAHRGVDRAASGSRRDKPQDAHEAGLSVDLHFSELRAEWRLIHLWRLTPADELVPTSVGRVQNRGDTQRSIARTAHGNDRVLEREVRDGDFELRCGGSEELIANVAGGQSCCVARGKERSTTVRTNFERSHI